MRPPVVDASDQGVRCSEARCASHRRGMVRAAQRPAPVVGVQLGDRERGDVDLPERRDRGVEGVHHRGLDDTPVRDGDHPAVEPRLPVEPAGDALAEGTQALASVSACVRIGHPRGSGLGLGGVHLGERAPGPAAEVPSGQLRVDLRRQARRRGRHPAPQRRAAEGVEPRWQRPGKAGGSHLSTIVERLVVRERRSTCGGGRRVPDQQQRSHGVPHRRTARARLAVARGTR